MPSTSFRETAQRLLESCLRGEEPEPGWLDELASPEGSREFFRVVVEGLADRFEPEGVEIYARLMAALLARRDHSLDPGALVARYARVRAVRRYEGPDPPEVVVLSRVTLGADVAITSRLLDAAKRRFPRAVLWLAGSRKAWELFAGDERIGHLEIAYPRAGSLEERLTPATELRRKLPPEALVLDPDSRLTQLGLLPVCEDGRYLLFDSRSFGGGGGETLGALTSRWCEQTLGVKGGAFLRPASVAARPAAKVCTVSLGVGENPAKRVPGGFETDLLRLLLARGFHVLIDKGAGGEEAERVERALTGAGHRNRITVFDAAFAPFAAAIMASDLYVGYDSAGQHVAAAAGVPLVSIFAGFPCDRMFQRWRPSGRRVQVIKVDVAEPALVLDQVRRALDRLAL